VQEAGSSASFRRPPVRGNESGAPIGKPAFQRAQGAHQHGNCIPGCPNNIENGSWLRARSGTGCLASGPGQPSEASGTASSEDRAFEIRARFPADFMFF